MTADPRLIVPLDVPSINDAQRLIREIGDAVNFYKIGLELLATDGMLLARELRSAGKHVFLDWKLHDIPTTVQRATAALSSSGCDFLTVHAEPQVMQAAVQGRTNPELKILAVTVLTSLTDEDLRDLRYDLTVPALVEHRIRQALASGCDGVIASPQEAAFARHIGGAGFLVVTPGIRPMWAVRDDQARAATPAEALRSGASHIVCGRPITLANRPRAAAERVCSEMAEAFLPSDRSD